MFKINYEYEGRKIDNLDSVINSLKRDMAESVKDQIEERINADLVDLRPEMDAEGGQLTATITLMGDEANISYETQGFSDDLDRRIFDALGFD